MFSANKIRVVGVNNYTGTTAASYDLVVTDKNGGTVGANDDLLFKQLLGDGTYQTLGVVKKDSVSKVTKVLKATAVPGYATAQAIAGAIGDLHRIEVALDNYGSDSFEDQYIKQGTHKATAATAISNANGLINSLYLNYERDVPKQHTSIAHPTAGYDGVVATFADLAAPASSGDFYYVLADGVGYLAGATWGALKPGDSNTTSYKQNALFEFVTTATGLVYVVEKNQSFVNGKFQSKSLVFHISGRVYDASDAYSEASLTVTQVGKVQNPVDAFKMANLEWFAAGYKADDYRGVGYPNNIETDYLVATGTAYEALYTIHYADGGAGGNKGAEVDNVLQLICASNPATASTAADVIEDAINTAWSIDVTTTDA